MLKHMVLLKNFIRNSKAKQANIFVQVDGVDNVLETWWMEISMGWHGLTLCWRRRTTLFFVCCLWGGTGIMKHLENKSSIMIDGCFSSWCFFEFECHPIVIKSYWQACYRIPQQRQPLWNVSMYWLIQGPCLALACWSWWLQQQVAKQHFSNDLCEWKCSGGERRQDETWWMIMEVFGHELRYFQASRII